MEKQQEISAKKAKEKIGKTLECIIDEVAGGGADARSKADAPEIDGTVFLRDVKNLKPGDIVNVKIEDAEEYDLYGVQV
jgi:ribosomal protein S12 methylthiotransferase